MGFDGFWNLFCCFEKLSTRDVYFGKYGKFFRKVEKNEAVCFVRLKVAENVLCYVDVFEFLNFVFEDLRRNFSLFLHLTGASS